MMAANSASLQSLFLTPTDKRGHVEESVRDTCMRRCRSKSENRVCFDCPNRNPTWMSITFGVWLCLNCSGKHRRMGVHITFVRSCDLDMFTPEQLVRMELGGNGPASEFFRQNGISSVPDYSSKLAERYRAQLDAKVTEVKKAAAQLQQPPQASSVSSPSAVAAAATAENPSSPSSTTAKPTIAPVPASLPPKVMNLVSVVEATPEKCPLLTPPVSASVVCATAPAPVVKPSWPLTLASAPPTDRLRAKKLAEDVDFEELFASAKALQ